MEIVEVLSVDGEYAEVKLPDTSIEWWPRQQLPEDVLPGDSLAVVGLTRFCVAEVKQR